MAHTTTVSMPYQPMLRKERSFLFSMLFHVALSAICFIGMMKKAINIEINAGKSRNLIQIKKEIRVIIVF